MMYESAVDIASENRRGLSERSAPRLTHREYEVLRVYATGVTTAELAAAQSLAVQTVRNHLSTIYRKLGVSCAVQAFIAVGWLRVPSGLTGTVVLSPNP